MVVLVLNFPSLTNMSDFHSICCDKNLVVSSEERLHVCKETVDPLSIWVSYVSLSALLTRHLILNTEFPLWVETSARGKLWQNVPWRPSKAGLSWWPGSRRARFYPHSLLLSCLCEESNKERGWGNCGLLVIPNKHHKNSKWFQGLCEIIYAFFIYAWGFSNEHAARSQIGNTRSVVGLDRADKNLLNILVTASLKCITIGWLKPEHPSVMLGFRFGIVLKWSRSHFHLGLRKQPLLNDENLCCLYWCNHYNNY